MTHRWRRRATGNLFNNQVLGVRVRQAERVPADLKPTGYRLTLLKAIGKHEVKAGQGSHVGQWRWHGSTVTKAVNQIMAAGWASAGKTAELTAAGRLVLDEGTARHEVV